MKSELIKVQVKQFPALYKKGDVIVLFEDEDCGTVVVGDDDCALGVSCVLDNTLWQRLPSGSQVILTQD